MGLLNLFLLSFLTFGGFVFYIVGTFLPYWRQFKEPCLNQTEPMCSSQISASLIYIKNCTVNMGCWYKTFYDPVQQEQYFGSAKDSLFPLMAVTQGKCLMSLLLSLVATVMAVNAVCKQDRTRLIWVFLLLSFSGMLMLSIVADFILTYIMNYNKNHLGNCPYSSGLVLLGLSIHFFVVIDGFRSLSENIGYHRMSDSEIATRTIQNDE
ncbi:uncharacterized protein LOC125671672 [Ostrea edulis]|uniref:uncharacterized protein LOC125671672 n=1 Tax=Ostrea edulis TaxID=37623 RepID=UPI0024AF4CA7|nr:uncharacterized protein LOC125671672 [Ostrea edulis]